MNKINNVYLSTERTTISFNITFELYALIDRVQMMFITIQDSLFIITPFSRCPKPDLSINFTSATLLDLQYPITGPICDVTVLSRWRLGSSFLSFVICHSIFELVLVTEVYGYPTSI